MKNAFVVLLVFMCAASLSSQNITGKLGSGGTYRILKSDNTTEVFKVQESDGFVSHGKVAFTPEGGLAIKITNKTGAASVKGTIITPSDVTDNAFRVAPAGSDMPAGIVYDDGIADGSECWVVVSGIAQVLMKSDMSSLKGGVAYLGATENGRAEASSTKPENIALHDREIGHFFETKSGGSLTKVVLHFR